MRFSLHNTPVWLVGLFGLAVASPNAPAADELAPLQADAALLEPALRPAPRMVPPLRDPRENYPNFISADRLHGTQDVETFAEGAVDMRTLGRSVSSDTLIYRPQLDEVEATGSVVLRRDDDVVRGPRMRLKLEDNVGYFDQPEYSISRLPGGPTGDSAPGRQSLRGAGEAQRLDFEGEGLFRLKDATYSTCSPTKRDWYVQVDELALDYNREVGQASNARVMFGGVPLFYSPWLSFSLNNQRKSGLLVPTVGSTSRSGFEYTQPVYWNIAPNADATFAPRLMQRRGTQWNSELRYLGRDYSGEVRHEYMAHDRIFNDRRYALVLRHNQNFGGGFSGALNFNGVSDDTYFSDLSTRVSAVSQGNLLRQGSLNYSGSWWNAAITAQRYQTLQDPALPAAVRPYARLPQVNFSATRPDLPFGVLASMSAEYVAFDHPTTVTGQRWTAYPHVALPFQTAAFHVTPRIGVQAAHYSLVNQARGTPQNISRSVPVASLDGGLALERGVEWLGKPITQTLEPRLYYVRIPHRDQSLVPVFDTALADFNATQMFSENRYSGSDRIGDANQLTAMVTTRLIDAGSGSEFLRAAVGQRYYFRDQTVTLPGEIPRSGDTADLLASVSGRVGQQAYADAGWQYNPRDRRTERFNVAGRYQPEVGKVLNAAYRYTRGNLSQVDVSAQWPVAGGWHGVGRYNYSMREGRVIESVGGVEFDGGCWVFRTVVQRVATQANNSNSAVYVQLELNGFSRIGSNPLELLKRNIPGYGRISQSTADPAFGAN